MKEFMQNIFDKWKKASGNEEMVSFTLNYTATVSKEFIKLLRMWNVPFELEALDSVSPIVRISTINYNDFISNKEYYSYNGVTEEIEENYYA